MKNKKQLADNEAFYDEKIAPLMTQIVALCKERDMPHVCCFQLQGNDVGGRDGPLLCSTLRVNSEDTVDTLMRMRRELQRGPDTFIMTIVTDPKKKQ